MKKKLFDNKTDYAVLVFIVVLVGMLAYCEGASAVEWGIEESHDSNGGITEHNSGLDRICGRATFDTGTSFVFCPLVAIGGDIKGDSFELGIADELWPRWEGQIQIGRADGEMDGGFSMRRIVGDGPFQLGIGGSYWVTESPGSNSNFTFNLSLRYTF